ncbi:hypothetical protein NPIL_111921 [Nephila pilipes]|uniref:Uncharacterized protein n=1 Tax=Nephila pilipes TaxID=299642 RepID=A0A8X6Q0C8_NEPPI|nr:hypothetical protein NPIL_111921 [Nephila pilipes]
MSSSVSLPPLNRNAAYDQGQDVVLVFIAGYKPFMFIDDIQILNQGGCQIPRIVSFPDGVTLISKFYFANFEVTQTMNDNWDYKRPETILRQPPENAVMMERNTFKAVLFM